MKSSTFHKRGLSKEKMQALEQIVSEKKRSYDGSPGVYVRNDKDRDLDLLWQGVKPISRNRLSRKQMITSFAAGIICTMFATSMIGNLSNNIAEQDFWQKSDVAAVNTIPINVSAAESSTPTIHTERYTIKSGDTLESVVMRFYGVYDLERIKQIQSINNIRNPNRIAIGKTLVIPID